MYAEDSEMSIWGAYLYEGVIEESGEPLEDEVEVLLSVDAGQVVDKQVLRQNTLENTRQVLTLTSYSSSSQGPNPQGQG